MERYACKLKDEIAMIESRQYNNIVEGVTISFKFELIPSDMKWLAFYSGELNNAAYYFSSFGNVNIDNKYQRLGTLGNSSSNTCQPWSYENRVKVAEKVQKLTTELEDTNLARSTNRNKKVLELIKTEKSSQEKIPILGKLIDKALAEPLHNTNNAWQYFNKQTLNLALNVSQIPKGINDITELHEDCPLLVYLNTIKYQLKCTLLYIKLKRWFQAGISTSFDFRFTG